MSRKTNKPDHIIPKGWKATAPKCEDRGCAYNHFCVEYKVRKLHQEVKVLEFQNEILKDVRKLKTQLIHTNFKAAKLAWKIQESRENRPIDYLGVDKNVIENFFDGQMYAMFKRLRALEDDLAFSEFLAKSIEYVLRARHDYPPIIIQGNLFE